MANVYAEKTIDNPTPAQVNNIFETEFGFVLSGDYYFSPIDPKLGIMADTSTTELKRLNLTLDGGATNFEIGGGATSNAVIYGFSYQLSENQRVNYMRLLYSDGSRRRTFDSIIAYDENDKAVHILAQQSALGTSTHYYKINHHIDNNLITADNCLYDKVNADLQNSVYKYPSLLTNCMFKELYAIVNLQSYPSTSNTYINFAGKIFRIVECACLVITANTPPEHRPYFAFPVGDA